MRDETIRWLYTTNKWYRMIQHSMKWTPGLRDIKWYPGTSGQGTTALIMFQAPLPTHTLIQGQTNLVLDFIRCTISKQLWSMRSYSCTCFFDALIPHWITLRALSLQTGSATRRAQASSSKVVSSSDDCVDIHSGKQRKMLIANTDGWLRQRGKAQLAELADNPCSKRQHPADPRANAICIENADEPNSKVHFRQGHHQL